MTPFDGLRVLVVEDEAPIAMMIEDMLDEMGCVVAGSAATLKDALKIVSTGGFDFALLDINLGGARAFAVADALVAQGVPFAFSSGYGGAGLPPHLQNQQMITKPFARADLEKVMSRSLCQARPNSGCG